jgi:hypothetical protein
MERPSTITNRIIKKAETIRKIRPVLNRHKIVA